MKPFDLEAAKAGTPVCTADGREARVVCFDRRTEYDRYPLVALVMDEDGEESVECYILDGRYLFDGLESKWDLRMKPIKQTRWVNLYKAADGEITTGKGTYETAERARLAASGSHRTYLGPFQVELEK